MDFKYKITKVREKLFISQESLAKIIGVSFATINRLENGHTKPSFITQCRFKALCKDRGIQFDEQSER